MSQNHSPDVISILNLVPVRIFWKDVNLRYLGCNQKFAEDAGCLCPDELIGKTDFELSWSKNAKLYRGDDQRVIESGVAKASYEEPQCRDDGSVSFLLTSKQPLRSKESGDIVGVLGTYDDVTSQRASRIVAEQKSRMEVIGQMAAGIAHDFNNMLVPMLAYSEMINQRVESDAMLESLSKGMATSIDQANAMCNELLLLAKDKRPKPIRTCPNALIERLRPLLKNLVGKKIEVATHLTPSIGNVLIDPVGLERVLVNLVDNSKDAMPGGGRISIRTELTLPAHAMSSNDGVRVETQFLRIAVTDNGSGIPITMTNRIFEPFVSKKRDNGTGIGLGLAICNDIVSKANGTISFERCPGGGTRFNIYLPVLDS